MKIEVTLPNKTEVFEMSEILGIDPDCVIGKLNRVWGWFNEHSIDGVEPISVVKILNNLTNNDRFCDAMVKVGWLEINRKNIKIPNFERHNSEGAKQRALTARRQDKHKKKKALQLEHNGNITLDELLDKTREDKTRVENNSPYSDVCVIIDVPKDNSKELGYE
jgi:hypothetical protein